MRTKTAILIFAACLPGMVAGKAPAACMAGLQTALIEGHFTGPIVCNKNDATFDLVGRTAGKKYSIYDYRYRYDPSGGSHVMHGGQKLIIFRGERYVGQYALSPPPYVTARVRGSQLVLEFRDTGQRLELNFSKSPPKRIISRDGWFEFYQ